MDKLYTLPKRTGRLIGRRRVKYDFDDQKARTEVIDLASSIPQGSNAVFIVEGRHVGGGTSWSINYTLSFYRITPKQRKSLRREERAQRDAEFWQARRSNEETRLPYDEERRNPYSKHYDDAYAQRTSRDMFSR
ncbi:hypothetical protein KA107_03825 [Candidatus Pacearchaeota archaeon]|nr:hypothetical protein [Candidatus Pacearchaeota archaeon]